MAGLFVYLGGTIDGALNSYVNKASSDLSAGLTPLVLSGLTIWVMVYGFAVMRKEVSEPINSFVWKILKISLILTIALSGGIYQGEIVSTIRALENGLVKVITPNASGNIFEVLDKFDERGAILALNVIERGVDKLPLGGWLDMLTGIIVFFANAVILLVCGGFAVMAKVATSFVLAFGPLFIACLAFEPVSKFFDAWLSKVINYLLLSVILAFAISLSIAICDAYLIKASQSMDEGINNQIADAFSLVILYGALLIMIYQAPHLASGLAGGASLTGGGLGNLAQSAIVGKLAGGGKGSGASPPASPPKPGGDMANATPKSPSPSTSGSGGSGGSGGTPAYRQSTLNNLNSRRK
jgi:type IV secretion system protein VirB6